MARRVSSPVLVGRAAELELLGAALADARAGTARVILIGGEAGIGKSRLLDAFAERAAADGARVLVGGCIELGDGALPHAPLAAVLRRLERDLEPDRLAAVLGPVRAAFATGAPVAPGRVPELALGVIGRLAALGPVVLAIEDLHWADRSTRDLLGYLICTLRDEPVVVVATYRSDELHRGHPLRPFLAALTDVRRIEPGRLGPAELAQLVEAIQGAPDPELAAALLARSDGNPFFAEELLAAGGEQLPDSLRDALVVRVERLPAEAQVALRVASCAGPRVPHRLLAAACGLPAAPLEAGVRAAVEHHVLLRSGADAYAFRHALVREAVHADVLPGERARVHEALAQALSAAPELGSAGPAARAAERAHHWRAAHRLDEALAASVEAGATALRFAAFPEAQRELEYALEVWDRVGDAAARCGIDRAELTRRAAEAAHLAADHERAIALAREAVARLAVGSDPVRHGLALERLGRYLWVAARPDEAAEAYRDAVAVLPAEPPSAERARIVAAQAQLLMLGGHAHAAIARCEEALAIAAAVGARAEEGQARNTLGACLSGLGRHEAGERSLRAALAIARELGDADDVARAYANLSDCVDQAGRIEEAAALALEGVEAAGGLGLGTGFRAMLLGEAAQRMLRTGRWDGAETLARRALALRPGGLVEGAALATVGQIAAARGDAAAGGPLLAAARERLAGAGSAMWSGPADAGAAELELGAGRGEEARRIVAEALGTRRADYPFSTARLHAVGLRVEAELAEEARARGDPRGAATARRRAGRLADRIARQAREAPAPELGFHAALCAAERTRADHAPDPSAWRTAATRADALGLAPAAAYARLREAEAALALGRRHAAAAPLRSAARTAGSLGADPLLAEIRALARRGRVDLGEGARGPAADLELTARECDVLRLVAAGRTNREIGAELYMSPKTASVHVSRILAKLCVRGRVEAAVAARRLGLD